MWLSTVFLRCNEMGHKNEAFLFYKHLFSGMFFVPLTNLILHIAEKKNALTI